MNELPGVRLWCTGLRAVGLRVGLTEGLWVRLGLGLSGTGCPATTSSVRRPSEVTAKDLLCALCGCTHFLGLSDSLNGSTIRVR